MATVDKPPPSRTVFQVLAEEARDAEEALRSEGWHLRDAEVERLTARLAEAEAAPRRQAEELARRDVMQADQIAKVLIYAAERRATAAEARLRERVRRSLAVRDFNGDTGDSVRAAVLAALGAGPKNAP